MIEIHAKTEKSHLVVKLSGVVNSSDYTEAMPTVEQLVTDTQPKGLLLDWTDLEGWNEEAESLRFLARLEQRSTFKGLAIIADGAWEVEINRCQEIMDLSVRRFPPSDRQAAEDWLASVI